MSVIGTAEIIVTANTAGFSEELKAGTAAGFAEQDLAMRGLGKRAKDAEAHTSKLSGALSKMGNTLSNTGIPGVSQFGKGLSKAGEQTKGLEGHAGGLNKQLSMLGGAALLGVGAAAVGIGALSVHFADAYQQATTSIANTEGISVKAANNIGSAFLGTAGQSKFSATEMASAFADVSGQLKTTQGSALTVAQSMTFMNAASDLAEAKQIDLATATNSLGSIMQAFQIKAKDAASATDVIYNSSNATGISVEGLSQQFIKMHSKLGDLGGGLKDFGGLLVALIHDGFSGRSAMTALSGGMTTLLKPQVTYNQALLAQKQAYSQLTPESAKLVTGYNNGSISSTQYSKAVKTLSSEQQTAVKTYTSAQGAITKAQTAMKLQGVTTLNAKGQFVGLGSIIDQLQPKYKKMTEIQQLAYSTTLFGASGAKQLTKVIDDGSGSYNRAVAAVSKSGSASKAAAIQNQTLTAQTKILGATFDDLFTQIGIKLIPIVTKLTEAFTHATLYLLKHKDILYAIAAVVGGLLTTVIGVFVVNKMVAFGKSFSQASDAVVGLVKKLFGLGPAAQASADETAASSDETSASVQGAADAIQAAADAIDAATQSIIDGFSLMAESVGVDAEAMTGAVTGATTEQEGVLEGLVATAQTTAAGVDSAFAEMGAGAGAAAASIGVAMTGAQGAMDATAATAATTAAEVDASLATEGGAGALGGLGLGAGAAGLAGGAAAGVGGGAAVGASAILPAAIAGATAYMGTDYLLHHTPLGGAVAGLASGIAGLFGQIPSSGVDFSKLGKGTTGALDKYGGQKGLAEAAAKIVAKDEERERDSAIENSTLTTIANTLIGQDVLPKDVRLLDRENLGRDIGTISGAKIAETLMAYLREIQQQNLRPNAGEVGQIIGTLNIHDAKLTERELVAELSWAVHNGSLGSLRP